MQEVSPQLAGRRQGLEELALLSTPLRSVPCPDCGKLMLKDNKSTPRSYGCRTARCHVLSVTFERRTIIDNDDNFATIELFSVRRESTGSGIADARKPATKDSKT